MTVSAPLILLFTDFGTDGPYLGQMEAAILGEALQSRVVNLVSDAPCGDPRASAYLLAALTDVLPPGCVVVAVVDPGVGGERDPLLLEVDGRTFVGPDNGLLSRVAARGRDVSVGRIDWRPERLSDSFHGRDLFAPVAAELSKGQMVASTPVGLQQLQGWDWQDELGEVVYVDRYGNAMTGLSAAAAARGRRLLANGQPLGYARTFSAVPAGAAFWYENSCGLVEIAVNQGRAAGDLALVVGSRVSWEDA
jgi:S-adenosylmethionine hydrolase